MFELFVLGLVFQKVSVVKLRCQSCISLVQRVIVHQTTRQSHMARLSRGHGSPLPVQQALPSVFLFVHKLWADRWPSFRLLTKNKKSKILTKRQHSESMSDTLAEVGCHVLTCLRKPKKESAWMTNNNIVSFDTRRSSVLFLSSALSG